MHGTEELDERLVGVMPSARQLRLQQMEFYAFVHFTVNTFTGKEWGDGTESPSIFHPRQMDADQWVDAISAGGMKGLILTCKHHDGFCLWPSRHTGHSVASSPYKAGRGDIVAEVSDACKRKNLAFGVYLSPWDRNHPSYGTGEAYDDYVVAQLTELLTQYGEICSVWFDGACGEGRNGKKQVYDWVRYYQVIRTLQPDACIHVCGPDVRWCGNEAGDTRVSEWSVVPKRTRDTERIADQSQQNDSADFRERRIHAQDQDLGSRDLLQHEPELIWYPAEVNTSIRPGWFYHAEEDDKVRSLDELRHIYLNAVGGNSTFLLNIPPTPEGLIHPKDCERLAELGTWIRQTFSCNLAEEADWTSSSPVPGHEAFLASRDDEAFFQSAPEVDEPFIALRWTQPKHIRYVVLKENLMLSQRIERFIVETEQNGAYIPVHEGSVVGYKRIVSLPDVISSSVRIRITDARMNPDLTFLGIYGTKVHPMG